MREVVVVSLRGADLDEVANVFGLLGEVNRLRIVLACIDGPKGVGEIAEEAGISPSLASHHLRLLRSARLLRPQRAGKTVTYELDDDHVRDVVRIMVAHVCDPHEHHAGSTDPADT